MNISDTILPKNTSNYKGEITMTPVKGGTVKPGRPKKKNPIEVQCDSIKTLLLEKNKQYGNSALEPIRIFSSADAVEQLRVRIDDKITRIKTSDPADIEDSVTDLIGYLILYKVAMNV